MTISVRTCNQDGSNPIWLGHVGQVVNWKHTKNHPGGASSASFDFIAPPDLDSAALKAGRWVDAYTGTKPVFNGRLEQPAPGVPWACTVTGNAALAKDYLAHITGGGNIYVLNDSIDQAISDGLPWVRGGSLTNPSASAAGFTTTIDGALSTLVDQGYYWGLSVNNLITTESSPPSTSVLLVGVVLPPRTLAGYATQIGYTYVDSSSVTHTAFANATSDLIARYGRIQEPLDLSNSGPLTSTQASTIANNLLTKYATLGLPWTGGFTVLPGQVFTTGGAMVTNLAVYNARLTVRVIDYAATGDGAGIQDIPIGQLDYDDTSGAVTLTPMAVAQDSLVAAIARANRIKLTSQ